MSTEKQERTPCLPMYHFIINPNAGSGRGWKVWRAIAGYMDRHNIEYEAVLTNGIGEARDAARELTKEAGKPVSYTHLYCDRDHLPSFDGGKEGCG